MQLELEAQEEKEGTDEVEHGEGAEEDINRLKETLAATTRKMEQISACDLPLVKLRDSKRVLNLNFLQTANS